MADLDQPLRIALVLTASTGGIGRHVASVAHPVWSTAVTASGSSVPTSTDAAQGFGDLGLEVLPLASLRRAAGADVVHAHGYKAGGLCAGRRPVRRGRRWSSPGTTPSSAGARRPPPARLLQRAGGPRGRPDPRREQ